MDTDSNSTNAVEWSVSELAGALKRTVEDQFGFVRVRGEISGYRGPHSSGHVYFSLKDANAKIDAVIWKGVFGRLKMRPEEGLEVIATGKMTTFPGKSSYQIVIDHLELAGLGALMALLEQRRRKLAAEGLFDEGRKQLIPYLPRVIGVVTSPTGAVIRDILHRLHDRCPTRVIVWPVRVQGETSAAEVTAAINGFNALPATGPIPRPDVLIVARGGGSLEDLMAFNDEAVVRAAAASLIPLISAIGHETDWTLIDQAADLRAPTPTGAAEKAVPVRADLVLALDDLARRKLASLLRQGELRRERLRALARALPDADRILGLPRQRLDAVAARLPGALMRNARGHEARLRAASERLRRQSPQARLAVSRERLAALTARLAAGQIRRIEKERERLARDRDRVAALAERAGRAFAAGVSRKAVALKQNWSLIEALSHTAILRRGFALVKDEAGRPLRGVADTAPGMALTIQWSDGEIRAVRDGPDPDASGKPAPRPQQRKPAPSSGQGGLFD
jgi:exodeoxyribonuclease VII large subunit